MRRALPLALCLSLAACERAVPAIGDVAADRTPWASPRRLRALPRAVAGRDPDGG